LYRKLYNRSLDFFLWVIDYESPPYKFKLHVQANTNSELKIPAIKRSIEFLIPVAASKPRVDVQFFHKKKQFKIFIEVYESRVAKEFFQRTFSAKTLTIVDENCRKIMIREMRSYLLKTEEEFI
jgi:hypothetical protein